MEIWFLYLLFITILFILFELIRWWVWCNDPKRSKEKQFMKNKLSELIITVKPLLDQIGEPDVKIYPSNNNESYSINKKRIYINIIDRFGKTRPLKDLVEIFIHELAHVTCKTCVNHDKRFQDTFQSLVDTSVSLGVLTEDNCMFKDECKIKH
jgi:hypothetical protein